MALPASGNSISLQQVNVELGNTGTDAINMGSSAVRGLFDVASGSRFSTEVDVNFPNTFDHCFALTLSFKTSSLSLY